MRILLLALGLVAGLFPLSAPPAEAACVEIVCADAGLCGVSPTFVCVAYFVSVNPTVYVVVGGATHVSAIQGNLGTDNCAGPTPLGEDCLDHCPGNIPPDLPVCFGTFAVACGLILGTGHLCVDTHTYVGPAWVNLTLNLREAAPRHLFLEACITHPIADCKTVDEPLP